MTYPGIEHRQGNFVVTHPRFPSFIIHGHSIGLDELKLKFYVERNQNIIDFFKREMIEQIEIDWVDTVGEKIDNIVFKRCRVKEVNCTGDWQIDSPTEVTITYEVGTMGKR